MGNSGSSSKKKKASYDAENCNDGNMGDGCVEIMDSDNVVGIKNCKIKCLNHWISKLEKQKDTLKKNVTNLERKLKRLSESSEKAISNSGF